MASRPAAPSSKRPTATPSEPVAKPSCKIHSLAIIADKAQLTGTHTVELAEGSILHPYCKIKAENGNVIIGKNSIINEAAVVGVSQGSGDVVIGDEVNIEASSIIEAKAIGDGTSIEAKAKIGRGAIIGKHCKITPLSEIHPGEAIADFTVVYGNNLRRHDHALADNAQVMDAKRKGQQSHLDLLRKLIPDASAKFR